MKNLRMRVLAILLALSLLVCFTVPVSAASYISKSSFSSWVASHGGLAQQIASYLNPKGACDVSEDGRHHADSYLQQPREGGNDIVYNAQCIYCGKVVQMYEQDLQQAYNDYVDSLPASGVYSDGSLLWSPSLQSGYVKSYTTVDSNIENYYFSGTSSDWESGSVSTNLTRAGSVSLREYSDHINLVFNVSNSDGYLEFKSLHTTYFYSFPISGFYDRVDTYNPVSGFYVDSSGKRSETFNSSSSANYMPVLSGLKSAGDTFSATPLFYFYGVQIVYIDINIGKPLYKVTPLDGLIDTGTDPTYGSSTRPSSGGSFGYMDADGQLNASAHGSIFDEGSGLYINPQTGFSADISDWYFDYSSRTYNLTTDTGDTITVTYGDEYVTITENNTTYNIYYITYVNGDDDPSSGTGSGGGTSSGSGDSGSSSGGLGDALGKLFSLLADFLSGVLSGAISLLTTVVGAFLDLLKTLLSFTTVFTDFLASLFPYMPSEVMTALSAGTIIVVVISIIKFIRG